MSTVQELSVLHRRYADISHRFRAAWTFHQFLQSLGKSVLGKVPDHWGPEVAGKHVVGITHFWTWQVVALELYDSVEAMRQVWQLD